MKVVRHKYHWWEPKLNSKKDHIEPIFWTELSWEDFMDQQKICKSAILIHTDSKEFNVSK